jgi:hypothetical protein
MPPANAQETDIAKYERLQLIKPPFFFAGRVSDYVQVSSNRKRGDLVVAIIRY